MVVSSAQSTITLSCASRLRKERSAQRNLRPRHRCPAAGAHQALYQRQHGLELDHYLQQFQERAASGRRAGPRSVYLVGTGPGDPGLLTLQAVHLLQTADIVLYDRLVSEDILRMANPEATMVYVGKQQGYHSRTQAEIHELLRRFAHTGARVVRLKGGDPFVFGRGAEESQYLEAHGVFVHIVPGITAAAGISALLGVPLTHRGVATSVRFLTGHAQEGGDDKLDATVAAAANPYTTLVVYMGLGTLPSLVTQLMAHGMSADLPAVAVERGTMRDSRLCHGHLAELPQRTIDAELRSPTLIIMGDVVAMSPGWRMWLHAQQPLTQSAPAPLQIDLAWYQFSGDTHSHTNVESQ